jgi:hypothetical protein
VTKRRNHVATGRFTRYILTAFIAITLGAGAIWIVADSENGYVGGMMALVLLVAIVFVSAVLLISGLFTIKTVGGRCLVLAAALLPVSFVGFGIVAKQLQLGAYRDEPMVSTIPERLDKVLFKTGVTEEQIDGFMTGTLGTERSDGRGHEHLPGLRETVRLSAVDGHEVVGFGFFNNATDEQREQVYSRIRSSPIVFQLIERTGD